MNRLPTKHLHGRTPFEAMHGRAPNLSHMRVFGSVCYPLNVIKNSKSMVTAPPHIFCGYDDSSQGYVCFDLVTEKFKVRATVQFDESWRCRALVQGSPIRPDDHPLIVDSELPYPATITAAPTHYPTTTVSPALPSRPVALTAALTVPPTKTPTALPALAHHRVE